MAYDTEYYDRLGLSVGASHEEIRKAYRKLSLKWHPDKNPTRREEAEQRFKELAEAYSVLSDQESRQLYDKYGSDGLKRGFQEPSNGNSYHQPTSGFQFRPADDIFRDFFGGQDPFSAFFNNMNMSMHSMFNDDVFSDPFFSRQGGSSGLRSQTNIPTVHEHQSYSMSNPTQFSSPFGLFSSPFGSFGNGPAPMSGSFSFVSSSIGNTGGLRGAQGPSTMTSIQIVNGMKMQVTEENDGAGNITITKVAPDGYKEVTVNGIPQKAVNSQNTRSAVPDTSYHAPLSSNTTYSDSASHNTTHTHNTASVPSNKSDIEAVDVDVDVIEVDSDSGSEDPVIKRHNERSPRKYTDTNSHRPINEEPRSTQYYHKSPTNDRTSVSREDPYERSNISSQQQKSASRTRSTLTDILRGRPRRSTYEHKNTHQTTPETRDPAKGKAFKTSYQDRPSSSHGNPSEYTGQYRHNSDYNDSVHDKPQNPPAYNLNHPRSEYTGSSNNHPIYTDDLKGKSSRGISKKTSAENILAAAREKLKPTMRSSESSSPNKTLIGSRPHTNIKETLKATGASILKARPRVTRNNPLRGTNKPTDSVHQHPPASQYISPNGAIPTTQYSAGYTGVGSNEYISGNTLDKPSPASRNPDKVPINPIRDHLNAGYGLPGHKQPRSRDRMRSTVAHSDTIASIRSSISGDIPQPQQPIYQRTGIPDYPVNNNFNGNVNTFGSAPPQMYPQNNPTQGFDNNAQSGINAYSQPQFQPQPQYQNNGSYQSEPYNVSRSNNGSAYYQNPSNQPNRGYYQ